MLCDVFVLPLPRESSKPLSCPAFVSYRFTGRGAMPYIYKYDATNERMNEMNE